MYKKILFFIFFTCSTLCAEDQKFIKSFVNYYDFSTVGRYTHEYHPFLFEKSSYSLDELEQSLTKNDFDISGRLVLTGYEEQAVPSYPCRQSALRVSSSPAGAFQHSHLPAVSSGSHQ